MKDNTLLVIFIAFSLLLMGLIAYQQNRISKLTNMVELQSDAIRNYHDAYNENIFIIAQEYLEVIDMDTNDLSNYSYCY